MANAILRYLSVRQDMNWFVHRRVPAAPSADHRAGALQRDVRPGDGADAAARRRPGRRSSAASLSRLCAQGDGGDRQATTSTTRSPPCWRSTRRSIRQLRATYYGMITQVDDQIGRLIAHLKNTGEYDHTLIVFTCDHGEMLGDHWLWGKPGYFDEAYHIPLIVRDPRSAKPTTAAARSWPSSPRRSTSCRPSWTGSAWSCRTSATATRCCRSSSAERPQGWRREVHWEYDFSDIVTSMRRARSASTATNARSTSSATTRYKYVHFTALPPLFFDLEKDPGQFTQSRRRSQPIMPLVLAYGQKLLSWRMEHNERSMTRSFITADGVFERRRATSLAQHDRAQMRLARPRAVAEKLQIDDTVPVGTSGAGSRRTAPSGRSAGAAAGGWN